MAIFRLIAATVLVASFVPLPSLPVPVVVCLTLASMHAVAAVVITFVLTYRAAVT